MNGFFTFAMNLMLYLLGIFGILTPKAAFLCPKEGSFKNKEDLLGTTYYNCTLVDGSLSSYLRKCPEDLKFDSDAQKCVPEFACSSEGRFLNFYDPTCNSYFVCFENENGTFTRTKYKCPENTSFDRRSGQCSSSYVCVQSKELSEADDDDDDESSDEENEFSSKQSAIRRLEFVCTEKGRYPDLADLTCKQYFLCSQLSNGSFIKTTYKCPISSNFDNTLGKCSASYKCFGSTVRATSKEALSTTPMPEYVCTMKGRFPDLTDTTCKKYFLCSKLLNGSFIRTVYNCPSTSSFDPSLKKCSANYLCHSTTTQNPIELSRTTEELQPANTSFTCTVQGRFPDPSDQKCSSYFLCSQLKNGTFIQTPYTCPSMAKFDSSLGECSATFQCALLPTSKPTFTTEMQGFICTRKGRFPDNQDGTCKRYYLCSLLNGTFINTEYNCPGASVFDPSLGKCSRSYVCSNFGTTQNYVSTLITRVNNTSSSVALPSTQYMESTSAATNQPRQTTLQDRDFICVENGRFADAIDDTCKRYYLCRKLLNGTIIKYSYKCPSTSAFDPSLGRCSSSYKCNIFIPTTPATVASSYSTTNTFWSSTNSPTSSYNNSSIIVSEQTNTSPTEGESVRWSATTINQITTKISNGSSFQTTVQNDLTASFGNSTTFATGRYTDSTYSSEMSSIDPSLLTTNHEPGNRSNLTSGASETTTSFGKVSTTATGSEQSSSSDNRSDLPSSASESTTGTEGIKNSTNFEQISTVATGGEQTMVTPKHEFICTRTGRFPDDSDETCSRYFLCSKLHNGDFIETPYNCPGLSTFDPSLGRCSKSYVCPRSKTTQVFVTTSSLVSSEPAKNKSTNDDTSATNQSDTTEETMLSTLDEKPRTASTGSFTNHENNNYTTSNTSDGIVSTNTAVTHKEITYSTFDGVPESSVISTAKSASSTASSEEELLTSLATDDNAYSTQFSLSETETSALPSDHSLPVTRLTTDSAATSSEGNSQNATVGISTSASFISTSKIGTVFTQSDMTTNDKSSQSTTTQKSSSLSSYSPPTYNATLSASSSESTYEYLKSTTESESTPSVISSSIPPISTTVTTTSNIRHSSSSPISEPNTSEKPIESTVDSGGTKSPTYTGRSKEFSTDYTNLMSESTTIKEASDTNNFTTETITFQDDTSSVEIASTTTTKVVDPSVSTTLGTFVPNVTKSTEFLCSSSGRFPDDTDTTCKRYFLCTHLSNGEFIKTLYHCPGMSSFDPNLLKCSDHFLCHRTSTTSGRISSLESSTKSYVSSIATTLNTKINADSTTDYPELTTWLQEELSTSPIEEDLTSGPKTVTVTSEKDYSTGSTLFEGEGAPSSFTKNIKDLSTVSEREPTTSLDEEGTTNSFPTIIVLSTEPELPSSTSPETNDFTASTKREIMISTEKPIENSRYTPTESTAEAPNSTGDSLSTSSLIENTQSSLSSSYDHTIFSEASTTDVLNLSSFNPTTKDQSTPISPTKTTSGAPANKFVCSKRGRFPDDTDITCKKYFLCTLLTNGKFVQTLYQCPGVSSFDPSLQKCSNSFVCLRPTTESGGIGSSTIREPQSESSSVDNTLSTSGYTQSTEDTTTVGNHEQDYSTITTAFQEEQSTSSNDKDTTSSSKSKPEENTEYSTLLTQLEEKQTTILGKGDTASTFKSSTTRNDFSTIPTVLGDKMSTHLEEEGSTSSNSVTTKNESNPSTSSTKLEEERTTLLEEEDQTSASKISTEVNEQVSTTSTGLENESSTASREEGLATKIDFTIKSETTSIVPETSRAIFTTSTRSEMVTSSENGQNIATDATQKNSEATDSNEAIPKTSKLTESTEIGKTTSYYNTKFTEDSTRDVSSSSSSFSTIHSKSTLTVTSTTLADKFVCSKSGRFPDYTDSTCKRYFLCSQTHNGEFIQTLYYCPGISSFDPKLQKCTDSFVCPRSTTKDAATMEPGTRSSTIRGESSSKASTWGTSRYTKIIEDTTTASNYTIEANFSTTVLQEEHSTSPNEKSTASSSNNPMISTILEEEQTPSFDDESAATSTKSSATETKESFSTLSTPITKEFSTLSEEEGATNITRPTTKSGSENSTLSTTFEGKHTTLLGNEETTSSDETSKTEINEDLSTVPNKTFTSSEEEGATNGPTTKTENSYSTSSTKLGEEQTTLLEEEGETISSKKPTTILENFSTMSTVSGNKASTPLEEESTTDDFSRPATNIVSTMKPGSSFATPETSRANDFTTQVTDRPTENGRNISTDVTPTGSEASDSTEGSVSSSNLTESTEDATNSSEPVSTIHSKSTSKMTSTTLADKFVCLESGRFPDYTDTTCKRYFLCSLMPNGELTKTLYYCPGISSFDPQMQKCTDSFICLRSTTKDTVATEAGTSSSTIRGESSSTTWGTSGYTKISEDTTTASNYTIEATYSTTVLQEEQSTSPNEKSTNSGANNPTVSTQLDEEQTTSYEGESTNLTAETNEGFSTLSTQITKELSTSSEEEGATNITRPTTKSGSENSTLSTTFEEKHTTLLWNEETTSSDETSKTEINEDLSTVPNETFTPSEEEGATNGSKSPTTKTENDYSTSSTKLEEEQTTLLKEEGETISSKKPTTILENFSTMSTVSGNKASTPLEEESTTDDFSRPATNIVSTMKPGSSFATPETSRANDFTTQVTDRPTENGRNISTDVTPTGSEASDSTEGSVSSSTLTESTEDATNSSDPVSTIYSKSTSKMTSTTLADKFVCSESGRFPDYTDTTCKRYFLCSLMPNGELTKTLYYCPGISSFDPQMQKCTDSFICPRSTTKDTVTTEDGTSSSTIRGESSSTTWGTSGYTKISEDTITASNYTIEATYSTTVLQEEQSTSPNEKSTNSGANNPTVSTQLDEEQTTSYIGESTDSTAETIEGFSTLSTQITKELFTSSVAEGATNITRPTTKSGSENSTLSTNFKEKHTTLLWNEETTSSDETSKTEINEDLSTVPNETFTPSEEEGATNGSKSPTTKTENDYSTSSTKLGEEQTTLLEEQGETISSKKPTTILENFSTMSTVSGNKTSTPLEEESTTGDFSRPATNIVSTMKPGSSFATPETSRANDFTTQVTDRPTENGRNISTDVTPTGSEASDSTKGSVSSSTLTESTEDATNSSDAVSTIHSKSTSKMTSTTLADKFVCSESGRFPDYTDTTCKRYFLCSLMPNGELTKTLYYCPGISSFDPQMQKCTDSFICPRSTTKDTVTTEAGTSSSTIRGESSSTTWGTSGYTKISEDTITASNYTIEATYSTTVLQEEQSTSPNEKSTNSGANNPTVSTQLEEEQTTSYIGESTDSTAETIEGFSTLSTQITKELFTSSVAEGATNITRPTTKSGSENSTLSTNFKEKHTTLLWNEETTSSDETSKTEINEDLSTVPNETFTPTGSEASDSTEGSISSLTLTESTEDATNSSDPVSTIHSKSTSKMISTTLADEFVCSESGRFPDYTDTTCKRYFLCSLMPNGELTKTLYYCPGISSFDPQLQKCTDSFICLRSTTKDTVTTEAGTSSSTIRGGSSSTASTWGTSGYTKISEDTTTVSNYTIEANYSTTVLQQEQSTSPNEKSTTSGANNPTVSTQLDEEQTTSYDGESTDSTAETNEGFSTLSTQITNKLSTLSDSTSSTTMPKSDYTTLSTFDNEETTSSYESSTGSTGLENETSTPDKEESSTTVTQNDQSTSLTKLEEELQTTSIEEEGATSSYKSSTAQITEASSTMSTEIENEPSSTTVEESTSETVNEEETKEATLKTTEPPQQDFHCQKRGYFANELDNTCQTFHFCDVMGDGRIYGYTLHCPQAYLFNPSTNLCTTNYSCNQTRKIQLILSLNLPNIEKNLTFVSYL